MDIKEYLKQIQFIRAFVKGPPKIGKTYLASSIARVLPTYYIDCEGGLAPARDTLKGLTEEQLKIEIIKPKELKLKAYEEFFKELTTKVLAGLRDNKYQALLVDSFSEIVNKIQDQYAMQNGSVSLHDWQLIITRTRNLASLLRDAQKHVIVTAVTKPVSNETDSVYDPALPGQTATLVPSYFDLVLLVRRVKDAKGLHVYASSGGPSIYAVGDRNNILDRDEEVTVSNPEALWQKYLNGLAKF